MNKVDLWWRTWNDPIGENPSCCEWILLTRKTYYKWINLCFEVIMYGLLNDYHSGYHKKVSEGFLVVNRSRS